MDIKHCAGCEDNFYNRSALDRCWSLPTAKLVDRYETGTWTRPTEPGAFAEVRVPSCYRRKGLHYSDQLPAFVKPEDVIRRRRSS